MPTQAVTAHLPADFVAELDQHAHRMERSRGWIVKEAVRDWLERAQRRDEWTREAIASADAGRLIEHEQVEEWLDSLGTANPKPVPQV
jgi:predicted transcriptional regulator